MNGLLLLWVLTHDRPSTSKQCTTTEVAAAIGMFRGSRAYPTVRLAVEFAILTATRSGETRGARWSEINLVERLWEIPAGRMKADRSHRVPLSDRAVDLLTEAGQVQEPWWAGVPLQERTGDTQLGIAEAPKEAEHRRHSPRNENGVS